MTRENAAAGGKQSSRAWGQDPIGVVAHTTAKRRNRSAGSGFAAGGGLSDFCRVVRGRARKGGSLEVCTGLGPLEARGFLGGER